MKNKLYVHDEAPEGLKENVRVAQECLDNMVQYQIKAENKTLTLNELNQMVQKNHSIIDQFPSGNPTHAGLPPQITGMTDLLALASSRRAEAATLTEKNPTVHKVDSLKDLHELSQKSPEEIGDTIIDASKNKVQKPSENETAEEVKEESTSITTPKKLKISNLDFQLFHKHLEKTLELLQSCKHLYFDLSVEWPSIEPLEEQMQVHIDGFAEHGLPAIEFLESYLTEKIEDEDLEEKKPAATFLLAAIPFPDEQGLNRLIQLFRKDEELKYLLLPALKYSQNPQLIENMGRFLEGEPDHVCAIKLKSLHYHGQYQPELTKKLASPPSYTQATILNIHALLDSETNIDLTGSLLKQDEDGFFETHAFTMLLARKSDVVWSCREKINFKPEGLVKLPLILSYAGDSRDIPILEKCLGMEDCKTSAIKGLGMLGLYECVVTLLNLMKSEDWKVQKEIAESLELITGAEIELSPPDIKEGPQGKEHEVEVVTDWFQTWNSWWIENCSRFSSDRRYRRGIEFDLKSCIDEMANPLGNHWSRQGSYYELRIRSGAFVTHFEADWYVNNQITAIESWQEWWQENQIKYKSQQWLFAGQET